MTSSDPHRITDELLSAYIDDEVTEQERAIVEAAIAADEEIAWRLNSLRQTVTLLHDLPELVLPRSFALTFDQVRSAQNDESLVVAGVAEGVPTTAQRKAVPTPQPEGGFWAEVAEGWRRFWQGGNPMLRNAATVSFALLLLVASGGQLIERAVTQPAGMMTTAPEAAPASESAANVAADTSATESTTASSAEAVALVAPTAEATVAKAADTESLQVQASPAGEMPAGNARIMQSQAEPSGDADSAESGEAESAEAASALTMSDAPAQSAEAAVAESVPAEEEAAPADEAVVAAAAAAPAEEPAAGQTDEETPAEEQAAEAVMAAPAAAPMPITGEGEPPLVANPGPGMGAGGAGPRPESGGGGMGGGPEGDLPPGADGALVPQQAYGFDVDATNEPTSLPPEEAEEAASASEAAPAESVTDVAATPAVEAVEAETATATVIEPTATAEAVALVVPGAPTSSEVVENTASDEGANLPVLWIAQATMLLLTVLFASLWWRSRKTS